jgi:ParB family transcriptional regulator, chromosome partitioning protein
VEKARVQDIPVAQIAPNPHNPRRLFDEEPMKILRESVEKLGILVPVTLYEAPPHHRPKSERFILLDGERRWRCAIALKMKEVPAIVVERPDDTRNILTMFHIHNVREGWQLMPTALKLEVLMNELKERNERKLTELTKLSLAQIRRCKILLTYPKKFQNMMLAPPSERMKADFFIELDRIRRPALDDRFGPWIKLGDSIVIDAMLKKYETEVIVAVTDFRRLAEIYKAAKAKNKKKRLVAEFTRFLRNLNVGIEDIDIPGATFAKEAKEIRRSARRLTAQLEATEPEAIASDAGLIKALNKLQKRIRELLEQGLMVGVRDEQNNKNTK